jgi:hypothetical protein
LERCRDGQIVALPVNGAGVIPLADRFRDAGFESALAVPLIVENGLFGILMTARNEANSCSLEETEFLKSKWVWPRTRRNCICNCKAPMTNCGKRRWR